MTASCQVCGKPVTAPITCPGCRAMHYCCDKHLMAHRDKLGHGGQECGRMAAQVERRQELHNHPFPWAAATLTKQPCAWLTQLGVHGMNAWRHKCPCALADPAPWGSLAPLLRQLWAVCPPGTDAALARRDLQRQLGGWLGLPQAQKPCLESLAPVSLAPLDSWQAYYRLRGLPLDSPAALLLDAVLTIHAAVLRLRTALQQLAGGGGGGDAGGGPGPGLPHCLVVHVLGPQPELDAWPLLLELGCLLGPQQQLEVHLVGPEVPAWAHSRGVRVPAPAAATCGVLGCACAAQPCQIGGGAVAAAAPAQPPGWQVLRFWQGQYHELAAELEERYGPPHVVVAPNAGLAAYPSWPPTLHHLKRAMLRGEGGTGSSGSGPLLCCFTDFNEEAVHRARQLCEHVLADHGVEGDAHAGNSWGHPQQRADLNTPGPGPMLRSGGAPAAAGSCGLFLEGGMNPFRCPAAMLSSDHALPSTGNAFSLWLQHQP